MGFYIYKYENNNGKIIYIGQTTNLKERIKQHTKDKLENFVGKIYYFECENKTSMNSWEYFLINKYHPQYNVVFNDNYNKIDITEPEWILYQSLENISKNNLIDFLSYKNNSTIKYLQTNSENFKPKISKTKKVIKFYCKHCHSYYETNNWYKTPGGHYGSLCIYCPYTGWAK